MTTITRSTPYGDLPEWMTVEEAAAYIGVGRSTAYDSARAGRWPVLRTGRLVRVHKSAFAPEHRS